jgi:site-specific recombinase XerD
VKECQVNALTRIENAGPALIDGGGHGGDLAECLRQHAEAARGAYARNTERALRADVAAFTAWCADSGRLALPASAETVAAFIDAMTADRAPATIRRYVSSVSTFHRAANAANPCETLTVKLALKRMHRERGRAQQQASPINDRLVVQMLRATGSTLRDLRDRALLVVAYTTMCRRSELVELLAEDLQVDTDGFGTIAVRRSKTDQEGAGDVAAITPDAMHHLRAWTAAAAIEAGPLFRAVLKGGRVGKALESGETARIFKGMAMRAGVSPEEAGRISGHSTRVGAAQDMVRHGAELTGAMQAGRWRSPEMLARYCRRLTARRGAVAKVADLREPFV